MSKKGPPVVT